jgi:hypothetical protein
VFWNHGVRGGLPPKYLSLKELTQNIPDKGVKSHFSQKRSPLVSVIASRGQAPSI